MAVDALELRPRGAIALFDAALRLCSTSSGVWALTLPTGAGLVAAVYVLAEAIRRHEALLGPVAFLTLAWLARAVAQGAACHYVDQQVVGASPASLRESARAALGRAPSLVVTAAFNLLLNGALLIFTLGLGFLFIGANAAAYASTMRGQGSIFAVYGTASKLLGPTRNIAPWVRLCGASQLLLAVNLQGATMGALALCNELFGFEVSFANRFTSIDNPTWLVTVAALTFALFEPLRAATAALMLIDGRVRQEGLDLVAQLEQLPSRRKVKTLGAVAGLLLALWAPRALAATELLQRTRDVISECQMQVDPAPLEGELADADVSALTRLVSRVEHRVWDDDDCESAEHELREGLRLYDGLRAAAPAEGAKERIDSILSRPEFQSTPDRPPTAGEPDDEEPGWFMKLLRDLIEWLLKRDARERRAENPVLPSGGDMAIANVVMIAALVLVAGVLIFILLRALQKDRRPDAELDESGGLTQAGLERDAMSALAKPPETWAGLADTLAAQGQYREAIRHLYLALLSRLHRDGAIDYDPTLSNWEYLLAFRGSSSIKSAFRELTRRFDFAWYGNLAVDALAYGVFRRLAEPVLATRPPEVSAHA